MKLNRSVEIGQSGAGLDGRSAGARVDRHILHSRKIDHQATVRNRMAGDVVSSAADRKLETALAGKGDCWGNVGSFSATDDDRGLPINHGVPHPASVVVTRVARNQDLALILLCNSSLFTFRRVVISSSSASALSLSQSKD